MVNRRVWGRPASSVRRVRRRRTMPTLRQRPPVPLVLQVLFVAASASAAPPGSGPFPSTAGRVSPGSGPVSWSGWRGWAVRGEAVVDDWTGDAVPDGYRLAVEILDGDGRRVTPRGQLRFTVDRVVPGLVDLSRRPFAAPRSGTGSAVSASPSWSGFLRYDADAVARVEFPVRNHGRRSWGRLIGDDGRGRLGSFGRTRRPLPTALIGWDRETLTLSPVAGRGRVRVILPGRGVLEDEFAMWISPPVRVDRDRRLRGGH